MSTRTPTDPPRRRGRPPSGGREATLAAALEVLTERGTARLTTREVAQRAGVSEGSVFYHFTDRTGLLTAVIEDGVQSLGAMGQGRIVADDVEQGIAMFIRAVEGFLEKALVVMIAAQSEAELRTALAEHLQTKDMGPHRGVNVLVDFLRTRQKEGAIRPDVDVDTIAALVYASCFQRISQRMMISSAQGDLMPAPEVIAATMSHLLTGPAVPTR
jgi:AcrR family transcriptional regulator